jgi:hypothetical protein
MQSQGTLCLPAIRIQVCIAEGIPVCRHLSWTRRMRLHKWASTLTSLTISSLSRRSRSNIHFSTSWNNRKQKSTTLSRIKRGLRRAAIIWGQSVFKTVQINWKLLELERDREFWIKILKPEACWRMTYRSVLMKCKTGRELWTRRMIAELRCCLSQMQLGRSSVKDMARALHPSQSCHFLRTQTR